MALLNWWTLEGLILLSWILMFVLAQHRVDRPPGLRKEDLSGFLKGFQCSNYDDFGRRLVPLYTVVYILMVVVALGMLIFAPL